ncbi:MAG: phosphonate ABC transporter, permease protein PhnE [Alphaproteobacteria bacterium]
MARIAAAALREALGREAAWRRRRALMLLAWGAPLAAVLWLSAVRIKLSLGNLFDGIPNMWDFFSRMFPPEPSFFAFLAQPTLETVEIAVWGTTLAVLLSIPLALLAARNTTPGWLVYAATRVLLNLLRSINELIYALLLVSAVGLGPFPGVLAIALHATGMLAKFCAEEIEHVDRGPVEALQATGASRLQIIMFGIVPQVLPAMIGYVLYRLDVSIRSATVLGLVGAGGLGFSLIKTMKLFKYHETAACIVAIIVLVWAADWISNQLRKRVL